VRSLIGSLATFAVLVGGPVAAHADDWEVTVEKDGVRVETREVDGCKIREVRATARFDMPAERLFTVLGDIEAYPEILPPTIVARLLRRVGDLAWFYMVIDPPVIARRDYCMRVARERRPSGELRSEWMEVADGCPKSAEVRMPRNSGSWVLTPEDGGRSTRVVYQVLVDPGGDIPAWMVNRMQAQKVPDLFALLKKAANMPRYAR
jgi:hypothetical protein